jgi:hypothetical protein
MLLRDELMAACTTLPTFAAKTRLLGLYAMQTTAALAQEVVAALPLTGGC